MTRRLWRTVGLVLAAVTTMAAVPDGGAPITGFAAGRTAAQRELEKRFDGFLDAAQIGDWIQTLSARPHHVGSPYGRQNAELMAGLFRSWGYDTRIEEFRVLFPKPRVRLVEMVAPTPFRAALDEEALAADSTSGQTEEQLPVYNAYSVDGDVTAELVYVNYGVPADYEELEKRGVSVAGKIVLARYYGSWRGIKPKVAAEKGAIGCLIYSDPADDGYGQGDVYPEGGYRPPQGAQRGSVADMPLYAGDPLTPGVGATDDADRLAVSEAPTITRIPVLPLSYRDAQPLLAALGGPVAPQDWRGGLPLTYHLGPGPATVHLKVEFDWGLAPIYDVIARLPGSEHPDQWIIRGNHHDAWVNGATDPSSGMAAELAEARAVGELVRQGFRPRRTLVYAAWDGEEPGLLGSTEWAERHAAELVGRAAVYINSDSNERGFLFVGGSHTLERMVNEVAREVTDPEVGGSVADRARAWIDVEGPPELKRKVSEGGDLPLSPLGSGSDFTPFLQHLGIASLNVDFGGEGDYGVYHSIYDSFDHYRRFMDPDFRYGVTEAQVVGRLMLRLAQADRLPFDFARLAATVGQYVDEVEKLADEKREETEKENGRIEKGTYREAWDPRKQWVVPAPKEPVPFLNFAPLRNALVELQAAAKRNDEALTALAAAGGELTPQQAAAVDHAAIAVERALTRDDGLPRRPWYVHYVYAPGFYTGYGVKTLPAVREAIEQRLWDEAEGAIGATAEVLRAAATAIDEVTAALPPPAGS